MTPFAQVVGSLGWHDIEPVVSSTNMTSVSARSYTAWHDTLTATAGSPKKFISVIGTVAVAVPLTALATVETVPFTPLVGVNDTAEL